jgi:hypothetical protein
MRRVVASEWVKLRRKGMLAALGGVIVVTILGAIITILTVGSNTSTQRSGGGPFGGKTSISFAQMASSHGLADALGNAGTLLGVIIMGVVAAAFAVVAALIAASSKGVPIHAWGSGSGIGAALGAVVELAAATLGWGVLGATLAIVFRSPVVAVVVGVVYALPLEGILGAIGNGVSRWLPGKLLASLAAGGNSTASLVTASWTVAVYSVLAVGLGVTLFTRKDVPV